MKIIEIFVAGISPGPNADGHPNDMPFGIVFTTHLWQYSGWFVAVYRIARHVSQTHSFGSCRGRAKFSITSMVYKKKNQTWPFSVAATKLSAWTG